MPWLSMKPWHHSDHEPWHHSDHEPWHHSDHEPWHHSDHDLFRAAHWSSMKPWHHSDHDHDLILFYFNLIFWEFALLSGKPRHLSDHVHSRAMHWLSTKPLRRPRAPWTTWTAQNCWVRKWQWTGVSSEGLDRPSQCGLLLLLLLAVV